MVCLVHELETNQLKIIFIDVSIPISLEFSLNITILMLFAFYTDIILYYQVNVRILTTEHSSFIEIGFVRKYFIPDS